MRSAIAGFVDAPKVIERPGLMCGYYGFFSGVEQRTIEFHAADRCWAASIPTNDGQTLVYVGWPVAQFHEFRSDIEGNLLRSLDTHAPALAARVRAGKREERLIGTADLPNFFRKSHGPGWALVGDAGYHKDPCTAQGISDSFRSAELLATMMDEALSGRRPLLDALADYERQRNEAAMPVFEWTYRTAEMRPVSPRTAMLLSALKSSQELTDRFLGLNAGTVLATDFFSPENLARVVGASG
jgi:2-polyprenyl-6-methoxyphenol hydroxylase-like FAD-dependent oxidoreductase